MSQSAAATAVPQEPEAGPSIDEFFAYRSIAATSAVMKEAPRSSVTLLDANAFAAADVKEMSTITDPATRAIALLAIYSSIVDQIQYQVAFSHISRSLWLEAHAAGKAHSELQSLPPRMSADIKPIQQDETAMPQNEPVRSNANDVAIAEPAPDYKAELAGKSGDEIKEAIFYLEGAQSDRYAYLSDPDLMTLVGKNSGFKSEAEFENATQAQYDSNVPRLAAYEAALREVQATPASPAPSAEVSATAAESKSANTPVKPGKIVRLTEYSSDPNKPMPAARAKAIFEAAKEKMVELHNGPNPPDPATMSIDDRFVWNAAIVAPKVEAQKAAEREASNSAALAAASLDASAPAPIVTDEPPAKTSSLEDNYNDCMIVPRGELGTDHAKDMVREDIASLSAISEPQARNEALLTVHANGRNQPQYGAEMGLQSPAIALEARNAFKAQQQRNSATAESAPEASEAATKPAAARYESAGIERAPAANDAPIKAITPAKPITPAKLTADRWGSVGVQQQATTLPTPAQAKKEKEAAAPGRVKKPKQEENPYAKGRAKDSTASKVARVLTHMAFGISGGLAVRALYNRITRKKTPEEKRVAAEKKEQKVQQKEAKKKPVEQKKPEQKQAAAKPAAPKPTMQAVAQKPVALKSVAQKPPEQKTQKDKSRGMRR